MSHPKKYRQITAVLKLELYKTRKSINYDTLQDP